jgi:pseudaminic acid cytidylyltransferase
MRVAIIPARGGSKRIPLKNIRPFAGQPIIAYSIQAARESELFEKILVSTDSEAIADVALRAGAEVPFIRPKNLAEDMTPTAPVLFHAIMWLRDQSILPDHFCCIYATAPFVRPTDIRKGLSFLLEKGASCSFSVTTFPFPILRAMKVTGEGHLAFFWPEYGLTRSNDLPEAYHDAGQFYWLDTAKFLEHKNLYPSDAVPVILPRYLVQDIDTEEDWITAEKMYSAMKENRTTES